MAERADIDRIRESVDIVDLISEVTKVRKSGRTFMAVCPFHEEKTPSMSVDRARGLYHCFGCGKGGDIFSFVQETQGLDFREALDLLARKAGVTLVEDPDAARRRGRRGGAVEALRAAIDVYHKRLRNAPDAGPARAYLRARGYDVDVIDEWKIGFAGTAWDTLSKELRAAGVDERVLADAGLSRQGRHGLYDFFRGRLMFPIHDVRGEPVGFGGRKVDGVAREVTNNPDAKYVNSPDSVVYQKSRLLYGLDRARVAMSTQGVGVVVEGYTDVIAMHLAGVRTAVATCGTALGDDHFDLLRRFAEKVVLAFDPDAAGSRAALRGDELDLPMNLGLDLRVAVMPDDGDPADLVQQGRGKEVARAVDEARPLLEFRIEHEMLRHDLDTAEGRARALHAGAAHLARVTDRTVRDDYAGRLAHHVRVDRSVVHEAIRGKDVSTTFFPKPDRPYDRLEQALLRVLLDDPSHLPEVAAEDFGDERLRHAFESIPDRTGVAQIDIPNIPDASARSTLTRLAVLDLPLPAAGEVLARIRERRLDRDIEALRRRLGEMEEGSDPHSDALRQLIGLQQQKRSVQGQ